MCKLTVEQIKRSSDWAAAFAYASFAVDDIADVEAYVEGENDSADWIAFGTLKDGRWFYLRAGCDYTGWDCQASGSSYEGATREDVIRMGMDFGARKRFGLLLPGEG